MIAFELSIPGLEEQLAKIRNWDQYANKRFEMAMTKSVITWRNESTKLIPTGSFGETKQGMYSEVEVKGVGSVIGKVGSHAPHAYYANFGRAPGKWPPLQAIYEWVERKKIAGVYSLKSTGKGYHGYHRRLGGVETQRIENYLMAKAIQRTIGVRGTKKTAPHFMEKGLEAAMPSILANFNKALDLIKLDVTHGN